MGKHQVPIDETGDREALRELLSDENIEKLDEAAAEAFQSMAKTLDSGSRDKLTDKQRTWVYSKLEQLGLEPPHVVKNTFTNWPDKRKKAEKAAAPTYWWEKNRPLRPPGK